MKAANQQVLNGVSIVFGNLSSKELFFRASFNIRLGVFSNYTRKLSCSGWHGSVRAIQFLKPSIFGTLLNSNNKTSKNVYKQRQGVVSIATAFFDRQPFSTLNCWLC